MKSKKRLLICHSFKWQKKTWILSFILTINIQYEKLSLRRRQVSVRGLADEPRVEVLATHVGEHERVDGDPVGALLERVVDDGVLQVPGEAGAGVACAGQEFGLRCTDSM